MSRTFVLGALAAWLAVSAAPGFSVVRAAHAQAAFPSGPIEIIAPASPGGRTSSSSLTICMTTWGNTRPSVSGRASRSEPDKALMRPQIVAP